MLLFDYPQKTFASFNDQEKKFFLACLIIFVLTLAGRAAIAIKENSLVVPVAGGTYIEGMIGQPTFINPVISANQIDQDIAALVYQPLANLIKDYEIKDNNRTYILNLKEDIFWDDGQPLTADDIIFTVNLIQNPEAHSPFLLNWQGVETERLSEIKVKFSLSTPYGFFAQNFQKLLIIPKHIFAKIPVANLRLSNYNLEPLGNGPYRFRSFTKKNDGFITEYRLVANPNVIDRKPNIKNLIFKFYENEDELLKAFRTRKIDAFGTPKPLDFKNLLPKYAQIHQLNMPRYYALFFNPNINPILKNQNLRYALTEAIDKVKLVNDVFGPDTEAALIDGPLSQPRRNRPFLDYEPTAAKNRLAQIKDADKIELNIITPTIPFLQKTAVFIQKSWQAIGLNKINIIELNTENIINEIIKTRNYEILIFGQSLENPYDLLPFWHSSQRFYPGLNLSFYQNKNVDTLIEDIRHKNYQPQSDLLNNYLTNLEKMIIEDAPAIFLYTLPFFYVHNGHLKGFTEQSIINPAERFRQINNWYVLSARIIK